MAGLRDLPLSFKHFPTKCTYAYCFQTGLVDASAPATVGFVDSFAQVQPGADSVLVQLKVVGGTPRGAVAVLAAAMDGHESGRAALQLGTNRTLATAV